MATTQVETVRKTAPAAHSSPARKTAGKPKATLGGRKLAATKAANKERTATSAPKPASMTEPLPPIVTLKHLAEWAGYNHGVAKKQAIEMFTGFVADIGRVLKKGSKIRIPNPTVARCGNLTYGYVTDYQCCCTHWNGYNYRYCVHSKPRNSDGSFQECPSVCRNSFPCI